MGYRQGGTTYAMTPGESLLFDSAVPHAPDDLEDLPDPFPLRHRPPPRWRVEAFPSGKPISLQLIHTAAVGADVALDPDLGPEALVESTVEKAAMVRVPQAGSERVRAALAGHSRHGHSRACTSGTIHRRC